MLIEWEPWSAWRCRCGKGGTFPNRDPSPSYLWHRARHSTGHGIVAVELFDQALVMDDMTLFD